MKNKYLILPILFLVSLCASAQDDLLSLAEDNAETEPTKINSFYGSRLILGHAAKTEEKNQLVLHVTHRFGAINSGISELFGLDRANIRIGFDYGITDNINIGFGRSKETKTYDLFAKYRIIQQNDDNIPLTLTIVGDVAAITDDPSNLLEEIELSDRLSYVTQLLIARNFGETLSLQLSPTYIHKNNLAMYGEDYTTSSNGLFALGTGASIFVTPVLAVNVEYYPRFDVKSENEYEDAFSIGLDLETGGHIFQIHLSNSFLIGERAFITETYGKGDNIFDGDIHIGFNITRTFQF